MKHRIATAAAAALSALVLTSVSTVPADAARCLSGADLRGQVSAFVHSLRDDVKSKDARHAVKGALVESVKAARGAKPDTPQENRGLGEEILALATQLKDAPGKVERKALIAEIHALQAEKRAARATAADVQAIRTDITKVKQAIIAKTDHRAEGRDVAAFVRSLMATFGC